MNISDKNPTSSSIQPIEVDYLIVGAGAVGMAFADVLLTESDASIAIVDRYAKPGGHWNAAYPFVQLHQPSQFYGVSSKELSGGRKERGGLNDGLYELATGAQVSAYFDDVMRYQFLPTGRVRYLAQCEYGEDGSAVSRLTGRSTSINVRRKRIDATFLKTQVPSTHTPNFTIDDGLRFMPLNDLPRVTDAPEKFVLIGGGKTAIDACLFLLQMGVDPERIQWIRPRDGWLLNRRNTQPSSEFFEDVFGAQRVLMQSAAEATSTHDLFSRLEAGGYFLRIDTQTWPQMFHGATVSELEIAQLRRVNDVVRLGRVTHIGRDTIRLDEGSIPASATSLYVDCSARPYGDLPERAVFAGDVITPQMLRAYQPVFSAALIAHLELNFADDAKKNSLATVVPPPEGPSNFAYFTAVSMTNQFLWSQEPELRSWIGKNRLDGFSKMMAAAKGDAKREALLGQMRELGPAAVMNLHKLHAADNAHP